VEKSRRGGGRWSRVEDRGPVWNEKLGRERERELRRWSPRKG